MEARTEEGRASPHPSSGSQPPLWFGQSLIRRCHGGGGIGTGKSGVVPVYSPNTYPHSAQASFA